MLGLVFAALLAYPAAYAHAQTLVRHTDPNPLEGVKDVLGGTRLLLENDDVSVLQVKQTGNTISTSFIQFNTTDSGLSKTPPTPPINQYDPVTGGIDVKKSIPVAQAAGRMYNIKSDVVAVLNANDGPSSGKWQLTVFDPRTNFTNKVQLNTTNEPRGLVQSRVVMGDFNGDGLADPLVFYSTQNFFSNRWGMKVFSAATGDNPDAKEIADTLAEGQEITGDNAAAPIPTTIVVGDFNNDGRDEIAALLADRQTVVFYEVDPMTLAIRQENDLTIKLPKAMVQDQVALAAGRFRNLPDATTGRVNADLVVFGQMEDSAKGYSIIPIRITPTPTGVGGFSGTIARNAMYNDQFYRFPDYNGASGAIALAASLVYFPQQIFQQLVLGIRTDNGSSYIEIGSFMDDDKNPLGEFDLQSETERKYDGDIKTYLQNIWVGNFDHLNDVPDNSGNREYSPLQQLETYEYTRYGKQDSLQPHIHIFDVNVPPPPIPVTHDPANWLKQRTDYTDGLPTSLAMSEGDSSAEPVGTDLYSPGDFQGRSLRLGLPFIVRIPQMTQPDFVLEAPPMHVDWIEPNDASFLQPVCTSGDNSGCCKPGDTACCVSINVPCVVNVSVAPTTPNTVTPGFSTKFTFDTDSKTVSSTKSTTSWGLSTAITVGTNLSASDGIMTATINQKNTTKYAHDNSVSKKYSQSFETDNNLTLLTGFSDHLFATTRDVNVYYYPVLGVFCGLDETSGCGADNTKKPLYVQFSVPSNVKSLDIDSEPQDWYQPVHEPGNVFSYPWSLAQLKAGFNDTAQPITVSPPAQCQALGSSTEGKMTQWTNIANESKSSGSTNTISDDYSVSYSAEAGIEGSFGVGAKVKFDIGASTSLSTLNQTKTSLSTSKGFGVSIPDFSTIFGCCTYGYGQYIFGSVDTKHPAAEPACKSGQDPVKDQCVELNTPGTNGKPVDVPTTGTMFASYLADPIGQGDLGTQCSPTFQWWQRGYRNQLLPDIALNHPGRWLWSDTKQMVTFQKPQSPLAVTDPFYRMRGFFITKQGDTGGPNIFAATSGDKLTLTARVYNFSLVNTTKPVHARIYGQLVCQTVGEASCTDNGATCALGTFCGSGFLIGEKVIDIIPAFESGLPGDPPNWRLASVDFDTSRFTAGNHMVFWVVAWMEGPDGPNGQLGAEIAGHGLKANPATLTIKQITDVPVEDYSNNVGIYPANQLFSIVPDTSAPGATLPSPGALKSVSLTVPSQLGLEQRTQVTAIVKADGAPGNVSVAFYDGDPAQTGTLLDIKEFAATTAGAGFYQQAKFIPASCGTHTLHVVAWTSGTPDVTASAVTNVTMQPQEYIQNLIAATQSAKITDAQLRTTLLALLNTALQNYQQGQPDAAQAALGTYQQQLGGSGIDATTAGKLTYLARVVFGCGSNGFLLTALPSYATVAAGTTASYNLALTPIGGFKSVVTLTCAGLPAGTACSLPQPITLDGQTQSKLAVMITTTSKTAAAAGFAIPLSLEAGRARWMLLLLVICMVAPLYRMQRLRSAVWGFILLLFLLTGTIGCGGGSSSNGGGKTITRAGVYTVIVQGTSGTTNQIAILTLVVK